MPLAKLHFIFSVSVAFTSFTIVASAQSVPTYPPFVSDAQTPITSSDGFNNPRGLAVVPGGTVYVADSGNHRVLSITPAGVQTTVSLGTLKPALDTPAAVALDSFGDLYIADTALNRIIKLPAGAANGLSIIFGAILNQPVAIASDGSGNLAIANAGNATIVARRAGGTPFVFNTGDTVLVAPTSVAFDSNGLLYVADTGNATTPSAIYRFPKLGGTGTNLTPTGYVLKSVTGISIDPLTNNLFFLDSSRNELILVPASGATPFLIPQSNFNSPTGIAADNLGNIYVSDSGPSSNTVTKLAYLTAGNFGSMPIGTSSTAITFNYLFYQPTTITAIRGIDGGEWNGEYHLAPGGTCAHRTYTTTFDAGGALLPSGCSVRFSFQPTNVGGRPGAVQIQTTNGTENHLVYGIGLGPQIAAMPAVVVSKFPRDTVVTGPSPIAINGLGTFLYGVQWPTNDIIKIPLAGGTSTVLNSTVPGFPNRFLLVNDLVVNGAADVYVVQSTWIMKIPADGSTPSKLNIPDLQVPVSIAIDPDGALYVADVGANPYFFSSRNGPKVFRVTPDGSATRLPVTIKESSSGFSILFLSDDSQGNIYFVDNFDGSINKIAPGTFTQTVLTLSPNFITGQPIVPAPNTLTIDASGTLYFSDINSGNLFYVPPGTGSVATASLLSLVHDANGNLPFTSVYGLAAAPNGKLYLSDGTGSLYLLNRTLGEVNFPATGSQTDGYVFNVGNQDMTFTDPTNAFTQSGSGAGLFTFATSPAGPPCNPASVVAAGALCTFAASFPSATGPAVTDTLQFLTNATNNSSVSLKLTWTPPPPTK